MTKIRRTVSCRVLVQRQENMKKYSKTGFTLVEILIVVALIGIILAIAAPNFRKAQTNSRTAKAKGELRALQTAVENYYIHHDSVYPASLSDLTTAVPKVINTVPTDPFSGGSYGYVRGGTGNAYYVIYSVGPSGGGSASISGTTVSESNGASCIFVSNAGDDTTP